MTLDRIKNRDAILEIVKKECPEANIQNITIKLNKASDDDLERTLDAFSRFGVKEIFDCLEKKEGNKK